MTKPTIKISTKPSKMRKPFLGSQSESFTSERGRSELLSMRRGLGTSLPSSFISLFPNVLNIASEIQGVPKKATL